MLTICRHDLGGVTVEVSGEVQDGHAKVFMAVKIEGEPSQGITFARSLSSVDELRWYSSFFKSLSGHGVLGVVSDLVLGGNEVPQKYDARTPAWFVVEHYSDGDEEPQGEAFIRTALIVKAGGQGGSMAVLTPSTSAGKPLALVNVFDFGNGTGNVDVIPMEPNVQMRALAFDQGGMVLNEPAPRGHLMAVAINRLEVK